MTLANPFGPAVRGWASTCLLLHLSEGTDAAAHEHFESLQIGGADWAISPALAGIHCVALERADFDVLAERGASMVWSPHSNLLLYGATAKIDQAKAAGLPIGLVATGRRAAARTCSESIDLFASRSICTDATYEHDVVIARGRARKRKKKLSKPFRDVFGHTTLRRGGHPMRLPAPGGYGHGRRLPVMDEVKAEAAPRELALVTVPTREAIRALQDAPKRMNAILQVTR